MKRWGFSMKPKCANCHHYFWYGEMVFLNKYGQHICKKCSEREHMPNIKITAEVNGKQVPLETISTETFEAIKALEKPKEIPVARVGNLIDCSNEKRLFLRIDKNFIDRIVNCGSSMVTIDLETGRILAYWGGDIDIKQLNVQYENIRPL